MAGSLLAGPAGADDKFTSDLGAESCAFVTSDASTPGNPLFPLVPGRELVLEDDEGLRVEIATCRDDGSNCSKNDGTPVLGLYTVTFKGIQTRVIEEREFQDGALVEISHGFFARCLQNASVYFFGEKVDAIAGGVVTGHPGAWEAGKMNAKPGVIMPGQYLLGARYMIEQAHGVALDRGENVRMGFNEKFTLLGEGEVKFENCVKVTETSGLVSGESQKVYCPQVGPVKDDRAKLVERTL
jgi:hypothetical protein